MARHIEIAGARSMRLLDLAEDRADALAASAAEQRRLAGEEYLPAELVDRILIGENALRVWRKHRGMSLDELARRSGTRKSRISEIENGKAQGDPILWRALADTLNVATGDIQLSR